MKSGIKSLHSMFKPVSCKFRTSSSKPQVIRTDSCTFYLFKLIVPFFKIQLIHNDSPKLIILLFFSFQVECLAITFHLDNGSHQQKDSTKSFNENSFSSF